MRCWITATPDTKPLMRVCFRHSVFHSWFESVWHEPLRLPASRPANAANSSNQVRKGNEPTNQTQAVNERADREPETVKPANKSPSSTIQTLATPNPTNQVTEDVNQFITANVTIEEPRVTAMRQSFNSDENEVASGPEWDDEAWCAGT